MSPKDDLDTILENCRRAGTKEQQEAEALGDYIDIMHEYGPGSFAERRAFQRISEEYPAIRKEMAQYKDIHRAIHGLK